MSMRATPETDKIIRKCKSPADTSSWVAMTMLCMRLERQRDELAEALRELVQLEADGLTESEGAIEYWERARALLARLTEQSR